MGIRWAMGSRTLNNSTVMASRSEMISTRGPCARKEAEYRQARESMLAMTEQKDGRSRSPGAGWLTSAPMMIWTSQRRLRDGPYRRPFRDKGHVARRKVDIGATEFGIDFEDDVCTVLTPGVGDMFHLIVRLKDRKGTWLHWEEIPRTVSVTRLISPYKAVRSSD